MSESSHPALLVLVGPTGTGKTTTAVEVAERLGGEVIGCDAIQVYRGLDAATGKPSREERARVPHHLIDVADPRRDFTLADYVGLAEAAVRDVARRGRVPLIVGGTGLYLRGLLRGIIPGPPRDPDLRRRLTGTAERFGSPRLHRWLRRLDPDSADRLPPRDRQRIVRALEVALRGKDTWSETLDRRGTWSSGTERFPALKLALDLDNAVIDARLEERVEGFFRRGLVEEVRSLLASGLAPEANALKAIGYREVSAALRAGQDPWALREPVLRSTRRYVRRQRTWFRGEPGVEWLDSARGPRVLGCEIAERWRRRGPGASGFAGFRA